MEYFAVIVEHGQVQRAAAALGLTQPALSKSLRRLEQAMKAKLLKRTAKGVELTGAGTALLARIHKLQLSLEDVTREISDLSQGRVGHLHIGSAPASGLAVSMIPAACRTLLSQAPNVTLQITVGTADMLLPVLSRGEFDLIVTAYPLSGSEHLVRDRLYEEEFVIYADAGHRLTKKKRVLLSDLTQERWALATGSSPTQGLYRAFADSGLPPPRIAVETNSVPFRLNMLPSTDLLGFGPRQFFQECAKHTSLVELPVRGLSIRRSMAVCYRKDAYISPTALRFIEILKSKARQMTAQNL